MDKYINKIINADCLDILKELPDKCIDLIVTDPAYLITSRGNAGNSGGMLQKEINKKGKVFDFNFLKIDDWLPECYRVLKNGSHCYIMCNNINLFHFLKVAEKVGFHFIKSLIWDKGNKIMGTAYMSSFEYILFFRKGEFKPINDCGTPDILRVPNLKTKWNNENIHDTEKPIKLMNILIENSSNKNDIVLDPFGGSCPVAVSCHNLQRRYICCEMDKDIYNKAIERLEIEKSQLKLF